MCKRIEAMCKCSRQVSICFELKEEPLFKFVDLILGASSDWDLFIEYLTVPNKYS